MNNIAQIGGQVKYTNRFSYTIAKAFKDKNNIVFKKVYIKNFAGQLVGILYTKSKYHEIGEIRISESEFLQNWELVGELVI